LLDRERARAETSFYFDSGDALEGSAVFFAFHGVPETLASEALGLDAQAVGNHDLTNGPAALAALRARRATFPLLAANLDELVSAGVAAPSAVLERNGVRLLVIGLGRDPATAVSLDANALAVEQALAGAGSPVDAVVVLSHLGRDADLALVPKTAGVDVVLGGHTHDVLDPPSSVMDCGDGARLRMPCDRRPVAVVHSGAYGRYLGRLDLTLSTDPSDVATRLPPRRSSVVESRFALLPVNETLPERPDVVDLLAPYRRSLIEAGFEQPVAFAPAQVSRSKPRRGDSALGNFVTHAMRMDCGADLALINSTGVRADLPKGELTVDDFFEVLPFEDSLVVLDISGQDLDKAFTEIAEDSCRRSRTSQAEIDGATVVFGCSGSSSAETAVGGELLDATRFYRVAAASFVAEKGQWLAGRGVVVAQGRSIRDVVITRARNGPPCGASGLSSGLSCVDAASGAVVDGRISWR
jgi:5'-nucleotidase